jgi:hypothetical protein
MHVIPSEARDLGLRMQLRRSGNAQPCTQNIY